MPRKQLQNQTMRVQTDPRNTFDYTTPNLAPVARPVDPYKQASGEGNDWIQLAKSLGIIVEGAEGLQPFMHEYAQRRYEEGKIAALTGKEKPSDGYFRIKAYEEVQGALTAEKEYRKALQDFLTENYTTASPEEIQQGLEEITQSFLNGQTENFIKGFAPRAQQLEQEVINKYHTYLAQEHHDKSLNIIGDLADTSVDNVINGIMKERYNDVGIESVEDLLERPSMYTTLKKDETFQTSLATALRNKLSEIQKQGLEMGLTRKEISAKFVEFLGRFAVRYGLPEALAMAYEKDESGISLAGGELSTKIANYKTQAEKARNSLILAAEEAAGKRAEQKQRMFINELDVQLLNLGAYENPEKRAQDASRLKALLYENPEFMALDNTTVRRVMKTLTEFQTGQFNFPDTSNQQAYAELYQAALQGTLDFKTLDEFKDENELSLKDWKELYEMVVKNQQAEVEEAREWKDKSFIFDVVDEATNYLVESNLGSYKDNEKAASFKIALYDGIYDYMAENDGVGPDRITFIQDILNPILETHGLSYGEIIRSSMGNTEKAPTEEINLEAKQQEVAQALAQQKAYEEDVAEVTGWEKVLEFVGIDTNKRRGFLELMEREVPEAEVSPNSFLFSEQESIDLIEETLDEGANLTELREVWTDLLDAESADFYIYNYLYRFAQEEFPKLLEQEGVSLPEALQVLRNYLVEEWNTPEDMIEKIMQTLN